MRLLSSLSSVVVLSAATSGMGAAQEAPSFHRDVMPVLKKNCVGCHKPGKAKGGLVLTSHQSILAGIDGDAVVVAGDPEGSVLLEVVVPLDGDPPTMPEKGDPLSEQDVDLLRRWIAAGAVDDTPAEVDDPVAAEAALRAAPPPVYRVAPVLPDLVWTRRPGIEGETLIAVPGRGEVVVHRLTASGPELAHRLPFRGVRIEALAVSPDGSRLAACGGSPARFGEVRVWGLASGEPICHTQVTEDCLFGVSWSPDGKQIAFGATDTVVRTIDAATGEQILFQGAHDDWVLDTCWSTDGSHLVSVGRDRSMKLTKVETQQFIDNITSITPGALKGGLIAVDRHPERDELLVGGADGAPSVFKMYRDKKRVIGDDFNRIHTLEQLPGRVFDLCWSQGGETAYAVCSTGDGGRLRAFRVPAPVVVEAEPTKDGKKAEPKIERPKPSTLWTVDLDSPVYGLALSPDGKAVAVGGREGRVAVFDAETGKPRFDFTAVPIGAPTAGEVEGDAARQGAVAAQRGSPQGLQPQAAAATKGGAR